MQNLKKLNSYTNSFISELKSHLKKGFRVSAKIYPASGEGAIIEFLIHDKYRSDISDMKVVSKINDTLKKIDQKMIGGNIDGVTFKGTNLYMDGQRIVVIKGEDEHRFWTKRAAKDDVDRVTSSKGRR